MVKVIKRLSYRKVCQDLEHAIFLFFEKNTAVYALIQTSLDFRLKLRERLY